VDVVWHHIDISKERIAGGNYLGHRCEVVVCPNTKCKRISFVVQLKKSVKEQFSEPRETNIVLNEWQVLPESNAKPQPEYIPKQIVEDYTEACRIRDLSPKASATLSRRCLQGMIRDFWRIKVVSGKLFDEIKELKDKISVPEWEAIDAVRSVGNIGAHMEKDVNIIIDVEPNEAQLLIDLIESLLKDWYVTRHDRDERMSKIKKLADDKKQEKESGKTKNEDA
jgi:hypothetical protein